MNEHTDLALVKKATDSLMEHFDTVQIFCTRHESDGTCNVQYGLGNWFARSGQVSNWLVKNDEESRVEISRRQD